MFVKVPPSAANAVTVKLVTPFTGSKGISQVTVPPEFTPYSEPAKVNPGDRRFVTKTFVTEDGPRFVIVTVKTRLEPARPLVGPN